MRITQVIAGDKNIKDLTPKGLNIGGRIIKNMRIAGSGIYQYHRREAILFGLDPSFLPGDQEYFYMYRPPEVLDRNRKLFARVPIITGKHVMVDQNNAKELTVGMVGDTVESEVDTDDGELYLYTTGTIVAGDGIEAYEKYGQLSVGYTPRCEWRRGTHRGTHYDAVLLDFQDVNHLLICPEARGGPQCTIMDSLESRPLLRDENNINHGGTKMEFLKKLFPKKDNIAGDARIPILLQSISVGADPVIQVNAIKAITDKIKLAGDEKTTWDGYLAELAACKNEDPKAIKIACDMVATFWKEKIAGDTCVGNVEMPTGDAACTGKPDCTCAKCKPVPGDNGGAEEAKEAEKKTDPVPGDAIIERFEKIESSINQLTQSVGVLIAAQQAAPPSTPGDSTPTPNTIGEATTTVAGDSTKISDSKKITVDGIMSALRS